MPGRIYVNEPINESPTWLSETTSLDFVNEGFEWGDLSDWEQSAVWHPNFSASYRFETP